MDDIKTSVNKEDLLEVIKTDKANPYATILPYFLNMGYSEVYYTGFAVQKKEFVIYATPASVYTDKEKIVRYTGGSAGVSVRIAKGLTLHQGARRGTPVRENVRDFIDGDLIITNKRVVFIAEKGNFEFKVEKLTACKITAKNAFILQAGNKSKNIIVDECLLKYVVSYINTALNLSVDGFDMYEAYEERKKLFTPELMQAYEATKKSIADIIETENSKKSFGLGFKASSGLDFLRYFIGIIMMLAIPVLIGTGESVITAICYGCLGFLITPIGRNKLGGKKRFLVGLLFFILFGMSMTAAQNAQKKVENVTTQNTLQSEISDLAHLDVRPKYDISEIVSLPGHPRIGDYLKTATDFQKRVNDDRIKVMSVNKRAEYERNLKRMTDDKTVVYFEEDPTHGVYVGAVDIKVYDKEFADTLDVDKAVEIVVSYLPEHFSKHYKKDAAYVKEEKDTIKYAYAVRLNNDGIDYHNSKKAHYSNYLSFYVIYYKHTGLWRIYTDYKAYAGPGLDWIQKFTKPWNINLNK